MKKRTIKLRFKLLLLACFLAYMGFVIFTQQENIGKLLAEQDTLTQQYKQVETDLNRLQHKSDYMDTKQYIEDTAHQKLGLAYDDELIFETNQEGDSENEK
jgi:cell division protein FtsL